MSQLQDLADQLRKTEEDIAAGVHEQALLNDRLIALDLQLHNLELAISERAHYVENLKQRKSTLLNRVLEIVDAS